MLQVRVLDLKYLQTRFARTDRIHDDLPEPPIGNLLPEFSNLVNIFSIRLGSRITTPINVKNCDCDATVPTRPRVR